jgi:phosphoglucomutase
MSVSPLAGKPAPESILVNVPRLMVAYYSEQPDPNVVTERVAFGTSGHRGSAFDRTFNEAHILAIAQAVCEYRERAGTAGPLFLGMDTHPLSEPAFATALEVLAANDVAVMVDAAGGYTPTPAVSHAILTHNRGRTEGLADGIVITPSHNPPSDGGIKYNPQNGGPADTEITAAIEVRANELLASDLDAVRRIPIERARRAATTHRFDYVSNYVNDLGAVIDMEAIKSAGLRI